MITKFVTKSLNQSEFQYFAMQKSLQQINRIKNTKNIFL